MRSTFILVILFSFSSLFCNAQVQEPAQAPVSDSIRIEKKGGMTFFRGDQVITLKQLKPVLRQNELAYHYFKASRASKAVSTVLGFTGGFLIGWSLGTAIAPNGEENWTPALVGAGVLAVSIPFEIMSNKKMRKAIRAYNQSGVTQSYQENRISLNISGRGIGLSLSL